MADEILVERSGGVVTVTLNRPEKKNALRLEDFDSLRRVCEEVAWSPADRVMVVTGAGDGFCSGADITDVSDDQELVRGGGLAGIMRMSKIHASALAFHRIPKPVIAAVNGVAAGAGCNLALGADIIYASETARFSEIFAKRGLTIDFGGSYVLPRLVGLHRAKELAFTAEIISAAEAERIGLVNRVVPPDQLAKEVSELAARLAKGGPVSLALIKESLNRGLRSGLEEALAFEGQAQALCFGTEDVIEAMSAFVQKREPEFKGR
jgi:2-(1,2-epoxy-1,2-dihydrophenyl)acetyl-CoA isomerase